MPKNIEDHKMEMGVKNYFLVVQVLSDLGCQRPIIQI